MQVQSPNLIERRGRIKPQDSCQNPFQESVKKEITRLLREGHIVKVGEIKEDVFLQPTVFTVKKERSVKIALDAREPNKNVLKDKYPMPNSDNLMDMIAEKVGKEPGETFFSTLDITYAYEQVELSVETSRQGNFLLWRSYRSIQARDRVLRTDNNANKVPEDHGSNACRYFEYIFIHRRDPHSYARN